MKAKELIERLQQLDPEVEVYNYDSEYGPEPIEDVFEYNNSDWSNTPIIGWCIN